MNYRRFGRTGWNVSEIGYGMWGLAGWTGSEDNESLESLQRAVDLGCNFFDTAWAYGDGHSEQLLGKILRANKNAANAGPDKNFTSPQKFRRKIAAGPAAANFLSTIAIPPDYIVEYVDKSLANIGVDTLDLIQFHTWEDDWLDDARLPRAIENLRSSGKVRAVGISLNRWEPCERHSRRARRPRRRRPGHLQHLRPESRRRTFPRLPRKRCRRHRPRPLR